jgi:hypothetical protein
MRDTEQLLADLAAIWVERWLAYGGSLVVDPNCDRVSISMNLDTFERKPFGPEPWRRWQRHWTDGWLTGRWRELSELCGLVPGLREAIIHHVALHGAPCGGGYKCMTHAGDRLGPQAEAEQA